MSETSRRYRERHRERINSDRRERYAHDERQRGMARRRKAASRARRGQQIREYERKRVGAKRGRPVAPMAAIHERAAKRKQAIAIARATKPPTKKETLIGSLKTCLPHLYDPSAPETTLLYRARYHFDPEFKAKEIERTAKRRSREHGDTMLSDGSLNGRAVQRLFAAAKACLYCEREMHSTEKTLDHIVPRHGGGWHSIANVVVCCYRCNSAKADKAPDEWLQRLPHERRNRVRRAWARVTRGDVGQLWL